MPSDTKTAPFPTPRWLAITEVVPMLGLSRASVYALAAAGEIPSVRIGRAVRFPREALLAWIAAREAAGANAE